MKFPTIRLHNVIRVNYGKALKQADRDGSGNWEVYGSSGAVGRHTETLTDQPTIIIGRKGSVGEITYAPNGGWTIDTAFYIEPTNGKTHLRYLYYALRRIGLARHTITTSIPGINRDDIYSTSIPLPPLPEQKRIAAILDKADAIRRKRKQAIQLTEQFLRSTFLDMFGDPLHNMKDWPAKSVSDVCKKVTDGTHDTPKRADNGVPYITGKHLRPFRIGFDQCDFLSQADHDEVYRRCNPEFGDILYTNIGVNLGTAAMCDVDYQFSMKNVALLKRKDEIVGSRYLEHLLNNDTMKKDILRIASLGGAQSFLSLDNIRRLRIPIPPRALQTRFEHVVDKVTRLEERNGELTISHDTLFNSLVQCAFRGEL